MRRHGSALLCCEQCSIMILKRTICVYGDITHRARIVRRSASYACCAGLGTSSPWACTRCWTSRSAASRSAASLSGCGGASRASTCSSPFAEQHTSACSHQTLRFKRFTLTWVGCLRVPRPCLVCAAFCFLLKLPALCRWADAWHWGSGRDHANHARASHQTASSRPEYDWYASSSSSSRHSADVSVEGAIPMPAAT